MNPLLVWVPIHCGAQLSVLMYQKLKTGLRWQLISGVLTQLGLVASFELSGLSALSQIPVTGFVYLAR